MDTFSYTLSPILRSELEKIDASRAQILLTPLSPRDELVYKWESIVSRIMYSLRMQDLSLSRHRIISVLEPQARKKLSFEEETALNYKKAYDYLYHNWFVAERSVNSEAVLTLWDKFSKNKIRIPESQLAASLDFIQINPEHPVVQAGLAQILLLQLLPMSPETIRFSCLTSLLFLYARGYDIRQLVVVEDLLVNNLGFFQDMVTTSLETKNVSRFLEHYTQSFAIHMEGILKKMSEKTYEPAFAKSYFELTPRQKDILSYLDNPDTRISNKQVQKLFSISQITASRDLARLVSLGLLSPLGKGRSVTYKRI